MSKFKTLREAAEAADYVLFSTRLSPRPTKEQWFALITVLVAAVAGGLLLRLFF